MTRTVTVAATQMGCSWDRQANLAQAEKLVREAAALVPDRGPTVASRTCMIVGGLLERAAQRGRFDWGIRAFLL